jgi:DNA-binding Lrp family transcriptional regulator
MSSTVFKRIVRDDIGKFPLDRQMLAVFMELDGRAPLGRVAQKTGLNMSTMREIIAKLMQNGLVEKVDKEIVALDKDFIEYMVAHLALAIGPVAQVLIEDEIRNLGYEIGRFPAHRVAELVDNLAREVRRKEKKDIFLKMMAIKIREKRYQVS